MNGISLKGGAKIAVEHEHFREGVRILFWDDDTYYTCQFTSIPMTDETKAVNLNEPFFRMSNAEAQTLTEALHMAGFRPRDGQGTTSQIEALQANLNDLRGMVQIESSHVAQFFQLMGVRTVPVAEIESAKPDLDSEKTE